MPSLINELLDWNNWNTNHMSEVQGTMPKMNVTETDEDYELRLCVPGLSKEDLNLSVDAENNLVIEMVQKEEKKEHDKKERRWLRREFSEMQFKQLLSLPEGVKKEQISAKVEHGILTIVLPKVTEKEKAALAQRIEIK
jgi:HSP20 family protein